MRPARMLSIGVMLAACSPRMAAAQQATDASAGDAIAELRELSGPIGLSKRFFGSVEFGRGFRFNNPYRLATELGSTAQSVSLTAPYADLALGAAVGSADSFQIGGALHASFAMAGVPQAVLTPTFEMLYRAGHPFMVYGRVGPSIIVTPNATIGAEVAPGFAWFVTGRIAVATEIVFDLYYGAGTHDVAIAPYPILSGQLGLLFDWEVLP